MVLPPITVLGSLLNDHRFRTVSVIALSCAAVTALSFLHVLVFLPRIRNVKVDVNSLPHLVPFQILTQRCKYRNWRTNELQTVVPVSALCSTAHHSTRLISPLLSSTQIMTAAIFLGWNAFLYIFARYTSLGLLWGFVAGEFYWPP